MIHPNLINDTAKRVLLTWSVIGLVMILKMVPLSGQEGEPLTGDTPLGDPLTSDVPLGDPLASDAPLGDPLTSQEGDGNGHDVTGQLRLLVDTEEPILTLVADWAWFPRKDYPWESIGNQDESRPQIHPSILTGYVNYGCHFEGFVKWDYEEGEIEILEDGWVRRRLSVTRRDQGGFYNNDLKFKCELLTKNKKVNKLLGTLVTMGAAPAGMFQSALVQATYMRVINEINTLDLVEGTFGAFLYNTFKSIMTLNAIDDNEKDVDLYFSPEGDRLEFEINEERYVVFTK